ncbi:ATP-binding protein [Trichocoleus sp. FACHB-262]|uniref:sensor histidine kinase n=1 Tax=Trichocoleus sp. FACHB-262 TaxID=2692869 RepID=UPI001682A1D8|nr:ATP-binding protein [Trichocoleus sp. FACHB-262]MBD2122243.1 PAS domain S-box protein [Trichocoleus sp. FACHB-262]
MPALLPANEAERFESLLQYAILDTEAEESFDELCRLAAYICQTPIALISLSDSNRQWFKAKVGLDATEVPRDVAFCSHAVLQYDMFVVPDTLADERFATNPLVVADPHIRFYAGSPLLTAKGHALGTLCTLDRVPRQLSPEQLTALQSLGNQVMRQLELRRNLGALARITRKRQEAEAALWQSREQLRNLVEQINDWVWEADIKAVFSYVSPKVSAILGYEPNEVIGKTLDQFMLEDEAKRYTTLISYFTAQQTPFTQLETTLVHKNGRLVVCESSASPIFGQQNQLEGYRGVTRDITERKQAEQQIRKALTKEKELSELKSRFINTASHEFRTPLTTILASAEGLEHYSHKWSDEKKLTYLHRIQSTVHHLNGLLNDVLLIGKSTAGKLEYQPTPLDLEKFCYELVEEVQLSSPNHSINFVSDGLCHSACMDEKLVRHILINLLSNAVKYSPTGGQVNFQLSCQDRMAAFQVQDSGIGIPQQDQKCLFESFHRATNVGNIPGTGLGLSIVKQAVETHRGTVSVNSTVGLGTTFTVLLPLNKE